MAKKVNKLMATKLVPSEKLAAVIGKGAVSRPIATKKVWDYIKSHKLQDKKDKKMIKIDAKLQPLFGKKKMVSMFDLPKMLKANLK